MKRCILDSGLTTTQITLHAGLFFGAQLPHKMFWMTVWITQQTVSINNLKNKAKDSGKL